MVNVNSQNSTIKSVAKNENLNTTSIRFWPLCVINTHNDSTQFYTCVIMMILHYTLLFSHHFSRFHIRFQKSRTPQKIFMLILLYCTDQQKLTYTLISLINVKSHLPILKNSTLHKKIPPPRLLKFEKKHN